METKLAWLAGLWDGEGSITIFRAKIGDKWKYAPTIVMTNTNIGIMNEVEKILQDIGVTMHWFTREHDNKKNATSYTLTTRKTDVIRKVVSAIHPYLVGKKPQAEIILRFLDRRDECYTKKTNGHKASPAMLLSDDDELRELCDRALSLNRKSPKSPTTTRETSEREMI